MIVELRQYTLHPGRRDTLVDVFDRHLVDGQEAAGMRIVGQFRDLDDPDRFVWVRAFPDMDRRAESLAGFYGGPVWKAHSATANATMIDSDDVLLLHPIVDFPDPSPDPGAPRPPGSVLLAGVCLTERPGERPGEFERSVAPALAEAGGPPLAWFETEHSPNTFPALPVREGVDAFVWFARFDAVDLLDKHIAAASGLLPAATTFLRLSPTDRSRLR